jgi:hypothetical protein
LGFVNFYRRFIEGYSHKAADLHYLTKQDKAFIWGIDQSHAFERIKEASTKAPAVGNFNFDRVIEVETDASDQALGAIISQKKRNWEIKTHSFLFQET